MNMQSRNFSSVTDEWPFQDHLLSKYIYIYQVDELCLLGGMNTECTVSTSTTDDWPSQDHLPSIALLIQKNFILGDLNGNHAVPPCRYETTMSVYLSHIKTLQ